MSMARILQNAGLTNYDTEDLRHLITASKSRTGAFCESDRCRVDKTRVEKYVSQDVSMCPDCGHALVWRQTTAPLESEDL
jgi:predicted RNA-binding Zn-ribbon protein involved in translation (DUF1610 family)